MNNKCVLDMEPSLSQLKRCSLNASNSCELNQYDAIFLQSAQDEINRGNSILSLLDTARVIEYQTIMGYENTEDYSVTLAKINKD